MSSEHLLFVCTANRCRSPMAESLAIDIATRRGLEALWASAGVLEGGEPVSERAAEVLAARGIEPPDHLSRQLDLDLVDAADVIVTMERRHLFAVADLRPDAVARSFPLRELVRIAPQRVAGEALRSWALRCDEGRPAATVLSLSGTDDIADPMGRSLRRYRRCVDELAGSIEELVGLITPGAP